MLPKYFWFFFLSVVASSPLDPPIETINEETWTKNNPVYRLPEGAVTVSYYKIDLSLEENSFESLSFNGQAFFIFNNLISSNQVQLHANGLVFSQVDLVSQDGTIIEITNENFESDAVTDILTLTTATPLVSGSYALNFTYVGRLRTEDDMHGFYRSKYVNPEGQTTYLGTTQFQPVHARRVFPCFDEPSYKAEFDISIRHPVRYNAVGNGASRRNEPEGATFATTTFATTPIMPTYLIAFVVSDFNCTGNTIEDGIPHYICSTPASSDIRDLALDFGPNITWVMEEFTGVKYSVSKITKIHQFAIPDFSAGAMENWGLITYRERLLLWDPANSSNRNKQNVITVVAHELAHFWFGNLVTCNWWSNTFLNEGFATYFEYHAPQLVDQTLHTDYQFVLEQLQSVLISDASPNSAPLSSPASSPLQISGRFSSISYNKGGCIFRMVQHFMGIEAFKQGLNKYISTNQFGNTIPEDLWSAFQEFAPPGLPSGRSIATVMERWVNNGGYPLLTVTLNGTRVSISQKRFLSSGTPKEEETWYVPISYTLASDLVKFQNTSARTWLLTEGIFNFNIQNPDDWIILNNQQTGYYRVDYDNNLWQKIQTALNQPDFSGIHELNRAQIVDDYFSFARKGDRNFSELLNLYQFLKNDVSYYPWYSAFAAFSTMVQRTTDHAITQALTTFILDLSDKFYKSVPFETVRNDDQVFTLSKVLVLPWACRLGKEDCVQKALAAFESYKMEDNKPDKNLRSLVYCNGLRHSKTQQADWDFLWNEFVKTTLSDEQVMLLSALGCSSDATVLTGYLEKGIQENSGIRPQDVNYVFSGVWGGNPTGVDVVLDFIINNFFRILASHASVTTLFNGVATRFTRQEQADKFEKFINDTNLGEVLPYAESALAAARGNLRWIQRFETEMKEHFRLTGNNGSESVRMGLGVMMTTILMFYYQYFY